MLLAIIVRRILVADDGHDHVGNRSNCLVAVGDGERHGAEVRVLITELRGIQLHVCRTFFGTCRLSRAAERKVGSGVERRREVRFIAAHAVLFAVVGRHVVMAGDRHRGGDLVDGLVTVGHVERHFVEVRVRVRELIRSQPHVRRSGIRPCHLFRSAERKVGSGIERRACAHVVVTHAVLLTVVVRRILVAGDRHRDARERRDLLTAVEDGERHRREVGADVLELTLSQSHRGRSHIGASCLSRAAEREVALRIESITDTDVVAARSMLHAVVGRRTSVTGDGHRGGNRADGLITVNDDERHGGEVIVLITKLINGQTHRGRSCVNA